MEGDEHALVFFMTAIVDKNMMFIYYRSQDGENLQENTRGRPRSTVQVKVKVTVIGAR